MYEIVRVLVLSVFNKTWRISVCEEGELAQRVHLEIKAVRRSCSVSSG